MKTQFRKINRRQDCGCKHNPNFKIVQKEIPSNYTDSLKIGVIVGLYETFNKYKNIKHDYESQAYIFSQLDYVEDIFQKLNFNKDITLTELNKFLMNLGTTKKKETSIYDTFDLGKIYGIRKAIKDILLKNNHNEIQFKIEVVESLIEKFKYNRVLPNITLLEML